MKTIALNIETEGNPALIESLPEPDVKTGNIKDPVKIKAKAEEARQKQLQRMALDPWFGRLLCVTLATRKQGSGGLASELKVATAFAADHSEQKLCEWVWKQLVGNQVDPIQLVTFNGSNFDIPYLMARSLIARTAAPHIETSQYRVLDPHGTHFDVMHFLHNFGGIGLNNTHNLAYYVKLILGEDWPYAELDQSRLNTYDRDLIKALCEWNTVRTLVLHEVIRTYLA